MPKPVTPLCGCDVFALNNEKKVLLIRRSDNNLWALPGGSQHLDESPKECAIRECFEETGLHVVIDRLLGIWSSKCYEYINYPWKDDVFTHMVFQATVIGGTETTSVETNEVGWFSFNSLPALSDGHAPRIQFGYGSIVDPNTPPYFE